MRFWRLLCADRSGKARELEILLVRSLLPLRVYFCASYRKDSYSFSFAIAGSPKLRKAVFFLLSRLPYLCPSTVSED